MSDYYSDNDDMYEDEKCPYCGSECLTEYEDLEIYDENDDLEHELEYDCHCTECGKDF